MMARPAHRYPQAEIGALGLVDTPVTTLPASISAAEALRRARRHGLAVLAAGEAIILREDLARAASLGVDEVDAGTLARPIPTVNARASEVAVRRHFLAGAPLVVVRDGRRTVGAVAAPAGGTPGTISLADRLGRRLPADARAVLDAVRNATAARDARAYLAGGIVRDALDGAGPAPCDLDVVVEGDGPGVARGLARALGAPLVEHVRFLTATVGPTAAGRIDVATARTERYHAPGALPRVMPASIEEDLRRRDFTVNAMAVELASGLYDLLDRHGGRVDLAARRLRILHPASFIEDPTRIFRGARYAARLQLRPDAWTRRCLAWALSLVPYEALSGVRIVAELERILAEARPDLPLTALGAAGVFRLLNARYRFTRATRAVVRALPSALAWAREQELDLAPTELAVVALLADQTLAVREAALRRLEVTGEPRARLGRALEERAALDRALAAARRPSARARLLRARSSLEVAWLWLDGDATTRAHVGWFRGAGRPRPLLRGDDVIALGVAAGPQVASVLDALQDARLDGEVGERGEAEAFVRVWMREHGARANGARNHSSGKER